MSQPTLATSKLMEREQAKKELYALLNEGLRKFGEDYREGTDVVLFTGEYKEIQGDIVKADSVVLG